MGILRKKIIVLVTVYTLSLVLFFVMKSHSTSHPVESLWVAPWLFLGSFLILPAFCHELALIDAFCSFNIGALLIVSAQAIAISFFVYVTITIWKTKDSFASVLLVNYLIGLLLNCGNYIFVTYLLACNA